MPIRPENRGLYPQNWPEIRARIIQRAKNRCEFCDVPNHWAIYRDIRGQWYSVPPGVRNDKWHNGWNGARHKIVRVVLTIAHLNHDPRDCRDENLTALCQRCHNRLDIADRIAGRRRRHHQAAAISDLFPS